MFDEHKRWTMLCFRSYGWLGNSVVIVVDCFRQYFFILLYHGKPTTWATDNLLDMT